MARAKSGVQITAFDLDVGIVSEHPAEVTKPGSLAASVGLRSWVGGRQHH